MSDPRGPFTLSLALIALGRGGGDMWHTNYFEQNNPHLASLIFLFNVLLIDIRAWKAMNQILTISSVNFSK